MTAPTIGSLCSGYGGLDLAVEQFFGAETAWFSEFDAAPSKILAHRWPGVPNLGDMTKIDWDTVPKVDIIAGGTPCQDLSAAGRRRGMTEGTRSNLWVQMRECIAAVKPSIVVWENVRGAYSARAASDVELEPGLLGEFTSRPALRALGRVLGDLSDLGFDAEVVGLRAADAGAPHGRFRVFVVAYTDGAAGTWSRRFSPGSEEGASTQEVRGTGRSGDSRPSRIGTAAEDTDGAASDQWRVAASGQETSGGSRSDAGGPDRARTDLSLLPTPMQSDRNGASADHRRDHLPLRSVLLPTPRASDGEKGGPNQRGSSGDLTMNSAVHLLPTPSVADATGGHARRGGDRGDELLLPGIAASLNEGVWGPYAEAIARWEAVLGRPAPAPTLPDGKGGKHRLNARLVEWLMGQPEGWVTDPAIGLTRNEQLKALGNGVVTQQAQLALSIAWARIPGAVAA